MVMMLAVSLLARARSKKGLVSFPWYRRAYRSGNRGVEYRALPELLTMEADARYVSPLMILKSSSYIPVDRADRLSGESVCSSWIIFSFIEMV